MTPEESDWAWQELLKHVVRVRGLLGMMLGELVIRCREHDQTKFQNPEREPFFRITTSLHGLTYGSPEYMAQLEKEDVKFALKHHYEHSRHHPEHYENGINGMTLVDLLEMMADWRAASERHEDGCIWKSIEINTKRFGLGSQLVQILKNTAKMMEALDERREFP